MKYTITGDNLQFVNIQLEQGEKIQSTANAMKYMSGNMTMNAKMKGGLLSGLKRSLMGESLFLLEYESRGGPGIVGLGGGPPGKILDLDISKGTWMVQKSGFLCSEETVNLEMAFQKKMGGIFFGGEGLILQKLSGNGIAFIAACGDFNVIDLKPGETYKVSSSNAVAWEESVKFDISATGGFKTAMFGGEGLFLTTLTGPGKIVIQSMTVADLAMAIMPYIPTSQ
ncbi:MAG: TIGR00266 family protein [Candidatus Methanomethylophilaceae archaeon]|nr:TIGR00266 family protein [Candidatus Methanomethylophilaceae archaeon]